jgi:hypothetical protein
MGWTSAADNRVLELQGSIDLSETGWPADGGFREEWMKPVSMALHDLCQPLTTLQCRLEMAQMMDTPEDYREAVRSGLAECVRLSAAVASMREAVRAVTRQAVDGVTDTGTP